MPNFISLPPELSGLEGRVQWVQQVNPNEYKMSCPNCGIDPTKHSDAHPSDRFIVWMESRSNGKPFGMCVRGCGYKWSTHKQDAIWTPEEKAVFAEKRKEFNQREEDRIRTYAESVVMKQKVYLKYFDTIQNSAYGKQWLKSRGFTSDEWNKFWRFGIFEDYKCHGELSTYYSPAITIPIVGVSNVIEQVKLRVTEAHHPNDRYRNIYKTNAQHIFFPKRENEIKNKVAIFEGEFKSCTVAQRGKMPDDVQIIGAQGKGIGSRLVYALEKCEVVYLCLDPDTFIPNQKGETTIMQSAKKLGLERVRIITCKQKVDDAILKGFNLRNAFNMAVKPMQLGLS
jgi:hypothetical protein